MDQLEEKKAEVQVKKQQEEEEARKKQAAQNKKGNRKPTQSAVMPAQTMYRNRLVALPTSIGKCYDCAYNQHGQAKRPHTPHTAAE